MDTLHSQETNRIVVSSVASPEPNTDIPGSDPRFRLLFENSPEAMLLMAEDGTCLDANPAACALFGYPREQMLMTGADRLMLQEKPDASKQGQDLLQTGRETGEFSFARADGQERIGSYSACSVMPGQHLYIFRDITEQKRIQAKVQESDNRARDFFGNLTDGFVAYSREWRIMYLNEVAADLFRMPQEALAGKNIWELFPEEVGSPYYEACHQAMQENVYHHREDYWSRYAAWYENHIFPIHDGIALMFRDITPAKQAQEALRTAEAQLRLITDAAPVLITYIDAQERICFVNRAYADWFGTPVEHILGKTLREVIRPDSYEAIQSYLQAALSGQTITYDRTVTDGSGKERHIFATYVPDISDDGEVKGFVGVVTDITERKQLENELRERSEQLSFAIAEAHHRIKNNLQAVGALLEMQIPPGAESVPIEAIRDALSQIKTIALVHDLLSRDQPIGMVDAAQVLTNLGKLLSQGMLWSGQALPIQVEAASVLMPTKAATALALAVNELITNAAKHSRNRNGSRAGDSAPVEVQMTRWNGNIVVTVQDQGPGFPSDFDPNRHANIGLQLVVMLVQHDLHGLIRFGNRTGAARDANSGACVEIVFSGERLAD